MVLASSPPVLLAFGWDGLFIASHHTYHFPTNSPLASPFHYTAPAGNSHCLQHPIVVVVTVEESKKRKKKHKNNNSNTTENNSNYSIKQHKYNNSHYSMVMECCSSRLEYLQIDFSLIFKYMNIRAVLSGLHDIKRFSLELGL